MLKKPKKYKKYVPPPIPYVSPEEAEELERRLRSQINTWGVYPRESKETRRVSSDGRPGINWQRKIVETLLPKRHKRHKQT